MVKSLILEINPNVDISIMGLRSVTHYSNNGFKVRFSVGRRHREPRYVRLRALCCLPFTLSAFRVVCLLRYLPFSWIKKILQQL